MRRAMPLKNGNTVAVERRVDLASLFCMIGRHGPAVALTVIAMVSVLAGLVIYRTVRGKRRKAAAAAAAAADGDGDGGSPVGAEGDASVMRERHRSAESTDVKDEGSSDVKEDVDLSLSDLRIRHRRAAAEKTPAPYSPPEITPVPGIERTHAEEANQSPRSDTCMAEMALVDAVDCHPFESGDAIKGASEDFRDSCLKEPETINADNHELGEEVSGAECQEDEGVTLEEDVLEETPRREDNFQCVLNDLVCFQQNSNMSDDDGLRDNKTTNSVGSNSEQPLIHTEDVPVPWVYYGKDEFERENSDGIDFCSFSGNARLSPEGESRNKNEEAEENRLDQQLIGQPVEIQTSTFQRQLNLPSVTDEGTPPVRDSDWVEDGGPAGEGVVREDHFNQLDAPLAQFNEQGVETEQKGGNALACDQEVAVLYDGADQVTEKMPTGGNAVACREERDGSSVVLSPALTCLSTTVKTDNLDGGLSRTAGIAELADLSLDRQPTQEEDDTVPSLDEDPNSNILGPQMPSYETANRPENIRDDTTVVVAEEHLDQVLHHHVLSRYEDKQSIQTISNAAFDQASAPADPDTAANVPSVIVEDICCPQLQSICQDQQVDHVENNEETRVDSASDAAACNNTSCTAFLMSKQLSRPDTRSSSQEQSDQTKHHEDFSIMVEVMNPPMCQIDLLSFEQFALMDYDISCAGVGEESGISSMAVSPDAINKYDVIFENTVLPMMDCDLKSEEQTEAQTSLFADDADICIIEEDTAGMVFGPSHCSQPPRSECAASTINESFASSQDMFGHEIENSYHRALDQFATQIADSVTCFAVKQFDMHVNESKEDKKEGSVEMKEATKAENEKEEDYKKTEISIMEATMDHNEWIMDSNYQAFPWMNLSASSFTPDDTKSNHPSFEECQYSSAVVDATCTDTTDIPPSAEVKQNDTLSHVDENTGYIKSAVVVQPMAQNVDVTFRVHYFTQSPYQTVAVTGNQQELGNWKGFVLLEKAKDGHWATVVRLPAESHVEWKFVVVDKGEVCRWEECGNRLLHTGSGDELLVHKCWACL